MNILEYFYDISPCFLQNIMVTISGYFKNYYRYGKYYHTYRIFLEEFDKKTFQEKLEYQEQELISFINFAYNNSKYYNKLYKDANVDINNIRSISDIKNLPVIDKEILRKNINDVYTINHIGSVKGHTGGTTGKSLEILMTPKDMMRRMAVLDHFKSRLGFENLKMKRATFNGKHIISPRQKKKVFWRYNAACKQMIYSSFHLTEDNMNAYIDSLNRYKPESIDGFFMSICDIANFIERHGITLCFSPIAIFPTSETLTDTGRNLLERVFKCKVYDQYSSSEGAPFITECINQIKHIEMSTGIFEQIDNQNNEVLITSFTTHGTPLIRYNIGDSMYFDDNNIKCNCGIESHIVKDILGRNLDFLYTAEGCKINSGNIANLFKNVPNAVIKAQVVQNKLDEIHIFLEIDNALYKSDYDDLIREEFHHKFGLNSKVIIQHVNKINREISGKYMLVKNNVKTT